MAEGLFNKKLLEAEIEKFNFPRGKLRAKINRIIEGWQLALTGDLDETKEKGLQGQFLLKFFGEILGYSTQTDGLEIYTMQQEPSTEIDATAPDGSLGFYGTENTTRCVIELKNAQTDLDKKQSSYKNNVSPVEQAFGYVHKYDKCDWIIVSNFKEIRLYHNSRRMDFYERFEIAELRREDAFKKLYFCLCAANLLDKNRQSKLDLLVTDTTKNQEKITNEFYKKFHAARVELFSHIQKHNPKISPKFLLEKTQKLLDRMVFIFFCEDKDDLLPHKIVNQVYENGKQSRERSDQKVWREFKNLFQDINEGRRDLHPPINAYNGGLFATDERLDNLVIKDDVWECVVNLTEYNFASDLNVNILGHIFEQSLDDIERLKDEIDGVKQDETKPKKSKRKKDGIFYTRQCVTAYIVEQTLGKLCEAKRAEMSLDAILSEPPPKSEREREALRQQLNAYRAWLLSLTICDPACGSGAFLNQALEFLIREHKSIDELRTHVEHGKDAGVFTFVEAETEILKNNLYGVDINEESVEIAQLSLWLRTARKGRKLHDLSHRIKLGNSLISDTTVASEKAFNWQTAFPEVFANGGFDVVIGNPPYVQLQSMGEESEKLAKCGFATYEKTGDLYCLFYERGIQLLKPQGSLGFITSNKWLRTGYGESLRRFLTTDVNPLQLIDFPGVPVFADATVDPHILILRKEPYAGTTAACTCCDITEELEAYTQANNTQAAFTHETWIHSVTETSILQRMKSVGTPLKDLPVSIYRGILTGYNDAFFIDTVTKEKLIVQDPKSAAIIHPLLRGRDIVPYGCDYADLWLIGTFPILQLNIDDYPAVRDHLLSCGFDRLQQTGENGSRKKTHNKWFEIQDTIAYFEEFAKPKIIYPNMTKFFPFLYDTRGYVSNDKSFVITADDDSVSLLFLTAIFNSRLAKRWIWYNCVELGDDRRELRKIFFENFPIPAAENPQPLTSLAERRTALTLDLQERKQNFLNLVADNLASVKINKKLDDFASMDFAAFLEEMKKQKVSIPHDSQPEWRKSFTTAAEECRTLSSTIKQTDAEIDRLVYKLYGLTPSEIAIVDNVTV